MGYLQEWMELDEDFVAKTKKQGTSKGTGQ